MSILTIIAVLIVAACMIYGYSKGFVRVAFSLVSTILLILLVSWATPHVTDFMKHNTRIYTRIQEDSANQIRERVGLNGTTTEQERESAVSDAGLPTVLQRQFLSSAGGVLEGSGFYESIGGFFADWIIKIIAFFIVLILAKLLLRGVVKLLDLFTKIPVIRGVNRIFGLGAGLVLGCLVVTLLMFLAVAFAPSRLGQEVLADIQVSPVLNFFYNYNGIAVLLNKGILA